MVFACGDVCTTVTVYFYYVLCNYGLRALRVVTQNVTQNIERRRGTKRIHLGVLGDFRPKKARKALRYSNLIYQTQLITRRSEVQGLLPQPEIR